MINFDEIEKNIDEYRQSFRSAHPFELLILDDFCDKDKLDQFYSSIPDPVEGGVNKSRDYVFAKNKFEKSDFRKISDVANVLYQDLTSDRFSMILSEITGQRVFIDPDFHGGGIHQGGKDSFLDMHVDFNFHPLKSNWFRNLNVLLYLNKGWDKSYGGQLNLRHKDTGESASVEPIYNRCVIMFTRDYTLHGYSKINFPTGTYRRSVAAYAYSISNNSADEVRSTKWYPDNAGFIKKQVGLLWPKLVKIKSKFFGSSTEKNK